jgi:hypothetical protein
METNKYQLPAKFCDKLERKVFWTKFFADQTASGLSAKKFCKLHQISYSTYKGNKYRAELKVKTHRSDMATTKNKTSNVQLDNYATKFLPLQITVNDTANQDTYLTVIDQCKPRKGVKSGQKTLNSNTQHL